MTYSDYAQQLYSSCDNKLIYVFWLCCQVRLTITFFDSHERYNNHCLCKIPTCKLALMALHNNYNYFFPHSSMCRILLTRFAPFCNMFQCCFFGAYCIAKISSVYHFIMSKNGSIKDKLPHFFQFSLASFFLLKGTFTWKGHSFCRAELYRQCFIAELYRLCFIIFFYLRN